MGERSGKSLCEPVWWCMSHRILSTKLGLVLQGPAWVAQSVYIFTVYDRMFGEFPARNTI